MKEPAGIYIHVPFCLQKCPYCDFYSVTDLSLIPAYIDAALKEIRLRSDPSHPVDSIYLGGGTPSVLEPDPIGRILTEIQRRFPVSSEPEVTLEVNPGTICGSRFSDYRSLGINRLNIGVQSFSNRRLQLLGRIHDADAAVQAIRSARRAGFDNLGLDLIYGLPWDISGDIPAQTPTDWIDDLKQAVAHDPEHLSCYMLTIEKNTPMAKEIQCGRIAPLPDESMAILFKTTVQVLHQYGYRQYEISNFARAQGARSEHLQSRHNTKYWTFAPYWGIGPGAHTFHDNERTWNHRSLSRYLADLQQHKLPISGRERLNRDQQITEAVYLGLRRTRGIEIDTFEKRFAVSFSGLFGTVLSRLENERLLRIKKGRCALTLNGQLLLDSICGMFTDQIPSES